MENDQDDRHYRRPGVWHKAMDPAVDCYRVSEGFPRHGLYGLTAHAASIPANIAEMGTLNGRKRSAET